MCSMVLVLHQLFESFTDRAQNVMLSNILKKKIKFGSKL